MISRKEFVKRLYQQAKLSPQGWNLQNKQMYDDEYDRIKFEKSLEILDAEEILKRFDEGSIEEFLMNHDKPSFDENIFKLSQAIKEDIQECTQGKYDDYLEKTEVSLIPLSLVHAFCTNNDEFHSTLDGYVICINQGLYFCLSLLGKAIVVENLAGELENYRNSGGHAYKCAIKLFLRPNRDDLNEIFFDNLPPEIYGEISAYQSKVSMMILQFIGLHEFGHIVNNDLGVMGLYESHLHAITGNETPDENVERFWDLEFKADLFALKALSQRAKSEIAIWANFIPIYLFFHWLHNVEQVLGKSLCPYHPAPIDRAKSLKAYMDNNFTENTDATSMLNFIEEISVDWINGIEKYMN